MRANLVQTAPMSTLTVTSLPHDILFHILSCSAFDVRDILALKQTCRVLRVKIMSILADSPSIYREKLALLAKTVPTGLPRDLSNFTNEELETAALTAYAVEEHCRRSDFDISQPIQSLNEDGDGYFSSFVVAVKVVPGGRWVISVSDLGCLSVWDTINEEIVAEDACGFRPCLMELEAVARGQVVVAVSGTSLDTDLGEEPTTVFSVYSLTTYPPPESCDDNLLVKKGCVSAIGLIRRLSISGPLVCGLFYCGRNHIRILVYDWQTNCGDVLEVMSMHFKGIPDAIIFPHGIILFTLPSAYRPALYYIKTPLLSDLSKLPNYTAVPIMPPLTTVVPEEIKQSDGPRCDEDVDFVVSLSLVVKGPDSSTSPSSVSLAYLAAEAFPSPIMACCGLEVEWSSQAAMDIKSEPHSLTLRYTDCERYASTNRVIGLRALGATTRQAVWVRGDLYVTVLHYLTMVGPSISREDNGRERVRNIEDTIRQFHIPSGEGLAGRPTALGFDESTATVAIGYGYGKISVCNFGPRGVVRW